MKVKIEIEASTALELAERLTKLAAHVLRNDDLKPIKILADDGSTVASLTIKDANGTRRRPRPITGCCLSLSGEGKSVAGGSAACSAAGEAFAKRSQHP